MADGTPRPSSTVILLDERADGLGVFLVRRGAATAFGDVWAFPGGVVEREDELAAPAFDHLDADIPFLSAAVRELFEETGVLLGRAAAAPESLSAARAALNSGELAWTSLLRDYRVEIDAAALHFTGHWITPERFARRFSTRFYLAAAPPGQTAAHCGLELTDSCWLGVAEAIRRHDEDRLPMFFPTITTLRALGQFATLHAALSDADARARAGIEPVMPVAVTVDGERRVLLPGDAGYPAAGA